jgi:beta-glucosidase
LPITFYRSTSDLPAFTDYSMSNRTYRYFKDEVMYPFGFGLSYSRFSYGTPHASSATIHAGDSVTVTAEVRNEGPRDGDEVVELYVKPPQTAVSPRVELEGFERIHLRAGEARHVEFTLSPRQLSEVDERGNRAVLPGDYAIFVAGCQPSSTTPTVTLHISGTKVLPQ